MKKFFTKDNIRGVMQSIVASILVIILLEPVIEIGKNLGRGIINSFVDYFFVSCAQVSGIKFVSYLAFFAFSWFAIGVIQYFLSAATSPLEKKKSVEIDQSTAANLSPLNSEKSLKEIRAEIDELKKQKTRAERILKIISILFIVLWVLFLFYIVVYQYIPATVNETFSRKIVQITPYVETNEIDLLKSEWVSMKGKDDYDRIAEKIENILLENDLK